MSWFNAIALRAIVIGLIGGADVGAAAGALFLGVGAVYGVLFGAVAGIPISLACAHAAALNISTPMPHRTAGPAFARPARTGCVILCVIVCPLFIFVAGPFYALVFTVHGLLIVTPLAVLIARAMAPWCLAEAVPRITPTKTWLVCTAFAAPVVIAIGESLFWLTVV